MSTLLQNNFTLFSLQIQVTECVLKPKKMVCVGILFSRNEFPYRKPYFAYCTYLSDCTESDSELVMYNKLCSLIFSNSGSKSINLSNQRFYFETFLSD